MTKIVSVYRVVDFKTGREERVFIEGAGNHVIAALRKDYPRFSRFILEGHEIDGTFVELDLKTYNRIR